MTAAPIIVIVDPELEELVPVFLASREREQNQLRDALEAEDADALRRLGHQIKGASGSYGFDELGEVGAALEKAGEAEDLVACGALVARIADYVARVEVVFGDPEGESGA